MFNIKNADNPSLKMDLQMFNDGVGGDISGASIGASVDTTGSSADLQGQGEQVVDTAQVAPEPTVEIPPNTDPRKVLANPLREWASKLSQQQTQQVANQASPEQQNLQQQQATVNQQDINTTEQRTPENELLNQIPDKFKLPDGSINTESLLKSYLNMEKAYGKQGQELGQMSELKRQIEELRSMIGQPQNNQGQNQQPNQQQQEPPQQQLSQEDIEKFNEEWMQKWYDNPTRAVAELVYPMAQQIAQQIASSQLQPLQPIIERFTEEQQINQLTERFEPLKNQNPDEFAELLPTMQQVIDDLGDSISSLPNPERVIYDLAKARHVQVNKPKTLEEMLADPNNRAKVLQDEAIRQEILKTHAQQIKQGQPPVVISNQPGVPPAAPPPEIKSVKDGTNALRAWLSRIGG